MSVDPITRLAAIEDIRILRARYWRFVDTKKWPEFGELFAPDATFEDHSSAFRCDGRDEIRDNIAAVFVPGVFSCHQGHQSEVLVEDEDHATGIWAMYDYLIFPPGRSHPAAPSIEKVVGYGHYFDEYVRIDGRWYFQKIDLHRLRLETDHGTATAYPSVAEAVGAA